MPSSPIARPPSSPSISATARSKHLEEEAERLQAAEADFWCEELDARPALDGAGQPCRCAARTPVSFSSRASCARSARRAWSDIFAARFFTGWDPRLARTRRFNPTSYHNGSVWPHDNALIALGLARYGHMAEALRLRRSSTPPRTCICEGCPALLRLRAPPRQGTDAVPRRVRAAGLGGLRPFALIQSCLGLEIDAASETVRLRQPRLPDFLDSLVVRRLSVGESRLDLLFQRQEWSVAVTLLSRAGNAEVEVSL